MQIAIQLVHPEARVPVYSTTGAAAFDLHAVIEPDKTINPRRRAIRPGEMLEVNTGVAFEVPMGWGLFLLSRSGHGKKHGIRLGNCVGLGDPDYRGAITVLLRNDSRETFFVNHGDRLCQAVLMQTPRCTFAVRKSLEVTDRGDRGYGSTGA